MSASDKSKSRRVVCAIRHLDKGDPRRFLVGTQAELSHTLRRCWQIALTSERIVCDIKRWKRALVLIIKAEGAKVPELDNRRGRRATS